MIPQATAVAIALGAMLGIGLWSLVSLVPRLNRPRLLFRVAPYVVDISPGARALLATRTVNPLPVVGTILGPLADRARAALSSLLGGVLGGAESVRLRLRQSGSALTVEGFRSRQLAWALVGAAVGTVVAFAATRAQAVPLIAQLAIVLLCGVAGVLLCDRVLQHRSRTRLDRMTAELPTVLEFLTLSLSAGEGIPDAIRRVVRVSSGELAVELAVMIAAVGTGLPFTESLRTLSDDLRLPPFSRAVEQIVGAIDRGTPLAEVLRAQAQDARDDAKRRLIETAGKKEVAMLVPLVFLILPTTIVFAIFPGIFVLQLGF